MGGLKTTQFTIDAAAVDITNVGSNGWKELLAGGGVRSIKISGTGIFSNSAQEQLARTRVLNNTIANYRVVDGTGASITCAFKITKLERAGTNDKEQTYSMAFESSGQPTVV
jgi:TP901-1 family phage major tail protein